MNYREILEDFVNNEDTEYCYDWHGFDYKIILPCIEQLLKNENNLQSKIDKAIEWIEQYEKQIGTLGETSKSIVLTDDVVIGNLLDILRKED